MLLHGRSGVRPFDLDSEPVIATIRVMVEQKKRKKKKKPNPVRDWLLYVAVRVLVIFLYLFDVETNLRFACFLGDLLWKYYER